MSSLRDRTSRFGVLAALVATLALGASTAVSYTHLTLPTNREV